MSSAFFFCFLLCWPVYASVCPLVQVSDGDTGYLPLLSASICLDGASHWTWNSFSTRIPKIFRALLAPTRVLHGHSQHFYFFREFFLVLCICLTMCTWVPVSTEVRTIGSSWRCSYTWLWVSWHVCWGPTQLLWKSRTCSRLSHLSNPTPAYFIGPRPLQLHSKALLPTDPSP